MLSRAISLSLVAARPLQVAPWARQGSVRFAAAGQAWLAPARCMSKAAEVVVKTHSTYCEGLIPFLDALSKMPGMQRIIPGRLSTARGSVEHLELTVQTATDKGWKCTARRGTQVQEVFIITELTAAEVESAIEGTHALQEKKTTWRTREAQKEAGQTLKSTT